MERVLSRVALAGAAAVITFTLGGCSSGSDEPTATDAASVEPAVALATLEDGPDPSQEQVSSWRSRLGLLQTYCRGDERFISDTIVYARKVANDHGADVTYAQTAAGITHEASAAGGASGQDCDQLAQQWVTSVATE